jgi:predicted Zn finger-like uncharacterized protein
MVVTCPNCRARYAVDPLKIGPAGRTVQCARCSHRWFERVESPPADGLADPAAPAIPPAPERVPEMVIRPTTARAALPAVIPPKPPFPWHRVAIAALVVLILVGALFAFRDKIAALLPDKAAATGTGPATAAKPAAAPAAPSRPHLEIDLAESKIEVVEGRYVVHGEVVNSGGTAGSTSLLRVTFKRNDDVLGERSFPLVEGPLKPGERASFSQVLEDPPEGTTDIVPVVE